MLTQEQQEVVDTVCSPIARDKIIAVNSIAGSGKTSTGNAVIRAYKPKNGFYTAFNKAIIKDSAKKFGDLLDCRTIHSLAYKYVRPSKPIEEFNFLSIKEDIGYEDKALVIDTLDDFYRSSSTNIEEYVTSVLKDKFLQDLVISYANKMLDGKIPPTFNYMLKCLHLMLAHKEITINYDLLILDECQDTTAVALEIFKNINANAKVIFGDKYQNIYSFMKTVNAFEELDDILLLKLTKSFRCTPDIAAIVEKFGRMYLEEDFQYKGNEDISPSPVQEIAYLSRTNAALIERMQLLLNGCQTFSLTRSVNEIFALPIALLNASAGREVYDKKYKFLEREYQNYQASSGAYNNYFDYLNRVVDDSIIDYACSLLVRFSNQHINLYTLKKAVTDMKKNNQIILTTAHAFKGLEKGKVYIEDDLNYSVGKVIESMIEAETTIPNATLAEKRAFLTSEQKENLNTYYVALSRAKTSLMNVEFDTPF